jgi:ABC-2 type transport system ATP-binding protein
MFINGGRIVLDCSMENFEGRYVELTARPEQLPQARTLKPFYERQALGRSILLFDSIDRDWLAAMGEVRTPSIADVFVAAMTKPAQEPAA